MKMLGVVRKSVAKMKARMGSRLIVKGQQMKNRVARRTVSPQSYLTNHYFPPLGVKGLMGAGRG